MSGNPGSSVITGMGAVASVGATLDEVMTALWQGRTGAAPLRAFEPSQFRSKVAYEIDDRQGDRSDEPARATRWLVNVIEAALQDAGRNADLSGVPVIVGTGLRELRSAELWWEGVCALTEPDLHFGGALHDAFGATQTHTISNACAASLYALGLASDLIDLGQEDCVVVAGVDAMTVSMYGLLDRVHATPPERVRPFDRNRQGVLMGEGAVAVVLERGDQVDPLRAQAVLRGVALSCDGYHVTAPDPVGIATTIRQAHALAHVAPQDVDLVLAHGTGTLLNDEAEATALQQVFTGSSPLVCGIKGATGHTSGGSGLLSLAVAVRSMIAGLAPVVTGLTDPVDEARGLAFVRETSLDCAARVAQVDAFGFGGLNAVAILEKGTAR